MSGSGQRTPGRAKASARRKSPEEREAARKRRLEQERAAVRSRRIRRGVIAAGTVVALVLLAVGGGYVHRLNGGERPLLAPAPGRAAAGGGGGGGGAEADPN